MKMNFQKLLKESKTYSIVFFFRAISFLGYNSAILLLPDGKGFSDSYFLFIVQNFIFSTVLFKVKTNIIKDKMLAHLYEPILYLTSFLAFIYLILSSLKIPYVFYLFLLIFPSHAVRSSCLEESLINYALKLESIIIAFSSMICFGVFYILRQSDFVYIGAFMLRTDLYILIFFIVFSLSKANRNENRVNFFDKLGYFKKMSLQGFFVFFSGFDYLLAILLFNTLFYKLISNINGVHSSILKESIVFYGVFSSIIAIYIRKKYIEHSGFQFHRLVVLMSIFLLLIISILLMLYALRFNTSWLLYFISLVIMNIYVTSTINYMDKYFSFFIHSLPIVLVSIIAFLISSVYLFVSIPFTLALINFCMNRFPRIRFLNRSFLESVNDS